MPKFIHNFIYTKEEQKSERKSKRRAASEHLEGSPPIKIINILPSSYAYRHNSPSGSINTDADSSVIMPAGRTKDLSIPKPRDKETHTYYQWHCGRIVGINWKKGFQER